MCYPPTIVYTHEDNNIIMADVQGFLERNQK